MFNLEALMGSAILAGSMLLENPLFLGVAASLNVIFLDRFDSQKMDQSLLHTILGVIGDEHPKLYQQFTLW